MNFHKALEKALEGSHVTREEWEDRGCYGFFLNGVLHIRRDFKVHQWVLSDGDVMAKDWEVV